MSAPVDRLSTPPASQVFSRPLVADEVPDDGLELAIEADAKECAAIAAEIGLPALLGLGAHYAITRCPARRLQVTGTVVANVTQICVVSLDPFDSEITQAVDATFAPAPSIDRPGSRIAVASRRRDRADARVDTKADSSATPAPASAREGDVDAPDPIIDGRIDLGAVAVEFLTLALDFYPKKPGVHFSDVVVGETAEEKPSAFAALARFKDPS